MKSAILHVTLASLSLSTFFSSAAALASNVEPASAPAVTFSLDQRPVDGILKAVDFRTGEFGGYDVILRTEFADRMQGKNVKIEEVVARSLECEFSEPITFVHCEADNRPVDGAFVKVEAVLGRDNKTFQITKETRIVSRQTGQEGVTFKTIAQGLELQD